ncbi:MAG: MFS transporter [Pirellulales bacterium]|nr:MFS transporter [Pirellulales bacterium]
MSHARAAPPDEQRLSTGLCLGYGIGSLATSIFATVTSLMLLFFLTEELAVPAAWAGLVVFVPKLWDVLTDPLVGLASDRTQSRWGRRRPYLLAGAVVLGLGLVLLFTVPNLSAAWQRAAYVLIAFLVATTGYTLFAIPYVAMPPELTRDYHELTRLVAFRMAFLMLGILVAGGAAPALIDLVAPASSRRAGYSVMGAILAAVCFAAMFTTFLATARSSRSVAAAASLGLRAQLAIALRNGPFRRLLLPYFLQLIGMSSVTATMPYFVRYQLAGGEREVSLSFVCLTAPAIVAMPLWVGLSRRWGKRRCYELAVGAFAATLLMLVTAASAWSAVYLIPLVTTGIAYAGTQLFPFAMLPDAIRTDEQRSGTHSEGVLTGAWLAGEKTGLAIGVLVASMLLSLAGFQESSGDVVVQPPLVRLGIQAAFAFVPAALMLISIPLLWRYDLDRAARRAATLAGEPVS